MDAVILVKQGRAAKDFIADRATVTWSAAHAE
jgi:hypothetical protein